MNRSHIKYLALVILVVVAIYDIAAHSIARREDHPPQRVQDAQDAQSLAENLWGSFSLDRVEALRPGTYVFNTTELSRATASYTNEYKEIAWHLSRTLGNPRYETRSDNAASDLQRGRTLQTVWEKGERRYILQVGPAGHIATGPTYEILLGIE